MKLQDIIFFLVFAVLLWKKDYRFAVWTGLICILVSIPLFAEYVFFTAERLIWYAASFFLLAIVLLVYKQKR